MMKIHNLLISRCLQIHKECIKAMQNASTLKYRQSGESAI